MLWPTLLLKQTVPHRTKRTEARKVLSHSRATIQTNLDRLLWSWNLNAVDPVTNCWRCWWNFENFSCSISDVEVREWGIWQCQDYKRRHWRRGMCFAKSHTEKNWEMRSVSRSFEDHELFFAQWLLSSWVKKKTVMEEGCSRVWERLIGKREGNVLLEEEWQSKHTPHGFPSIITCFDTSFISLPSWGSSKWREGRRGYPETLMCAWRSKKKRMSFREEMNIFKEINDVHGRFQKKKKTLMSR